MSPEISLISFGYFEKGFLEKVSGAIGQEFLLPVSISENRMDLSVFYNPGRRQYDGGRMLKEIDRISLPGSAKTLGLFGVDLYIPILTYIFGQAYLGGSAGIASTYRLKNELYGLKQDEDLLCERFKKVCIHELGHAFGLIHCHSLTCVMHSSTYVEDLDQKTRHFCARCREEIK
jgi:archaemetzincin